MHLITHAALTGSRQGAYTLGEAYYYGKYGLPKNDAQAKHWLGKASTSSMNDLHVNDAARAARWLAELQ